MNKLASPTYLWLLFTTSFVNCFFSSQTFDKFCFIQVAIRLMLQPLPFFTFGLHKHTDDQTTQKSISVTAETCMGLIETIRNKWTHRTGKDMTVGIGQKAFTAQRLSLRNAQDRINYTLRYGKTNQPAKLQYGADFYTRIPNVPMNYQWITGWDYTRIPNVPMIAVN